MTYLLTAHNIVHSYIAITGIAPITLNISEGMCVWLKGDNGAGKSTFLKLAAGVLPVEAGQLDVYASFSYLGAEWGMKMHARLADYQRFMAVLGVTNHISELPQSRELNDFSSGQKLWIRLSSALRSDRLLWLLDEPSRFLDAKHEALLWEKVSHHCAAGGAVLVASHSAVLPECKVDTYLI